MYWENLGIPTPCETITYEEGICMYMLWLLQLFTQAPTADSNGPEVQRLRVFPKTMT